MLTKIGNSEKITKQHGGFGIEILYPGAVTPNAKDTGIGTIGRIDQAKVMPGTLVVMHAHRDDEILTYLRSGSVKHLDSEGITEIISSSKLMMMNAGKRFYHEELVLEAGEVLEGLQIFIRPEQSGLQPRVQFYDLPEKFSVNEWRKIAGKNKNYPLEIRSDTQIQDIRLEEGSSTTLPMIPGEKLSLLFYVFDGKIQVNDEFTLEKGECVLIEGASPTFTALQTSDIVLFVTSKEATYFEGGMYSGNLKN
ncbi:MAG TPA: pirin family protein [Chitinophagaceae bacterium]|nr:pirin family protein [Chitinophagaceae bacterium]